MVFRDRTPHTPIGFGVPYSSLPVPSDDLVGDADAGGIARFFEDKPIAKFLAAGIATIASAGLAHKVIRPQGGKALSWMAGKAATEGPSSIYGKSLKTFRDVQSTMDELQGVTRQRGTMSLDGDLFDDPTDDIVQELTGFHYAQGDRQRALRLGLEDPGDWTYKNEIQQRLVRQARRLPYELTGAYVMQRGLTDHILGIEKEDVNWANPIDVIGDFAKESAKNLAFAFIPFEVGVGAAKHSWRSSLTRGYDNGLLGAGQTGRSLAVDVNETLKMLGQDFSDITSEVVKFSKMTTGATASAVSRTAAKERSIVDHMHQIRQGGMRKWWDRVLKGEEVVGAAGQAVDVVRPFAQAIKRKSWSPFGVSVDAEDLSSVSMFERIAMSTAKLGGRDDITSGIIYQKLAQRSYSNSVRKELINAGVSERDASRVSSIFSFRAPKGRGDTTHLSNRIFVHGEAIRAEDIPGFMRDKLSPVLGAGERTDAIADNLKRVMARADKAFIHDRSQLKVTAESLWDEAYSGAIAPEARRMLGYKKMAYSDFNPGSMTRASEEFLTRRAAERMGVQLRVAGTSKSTSTIRAELSGLGLDPSNKEQLRSFLVTKGDISKPWNPRGQNLFGLSSISVSEAIKLNIVGDDAKNLAKQIKRSDWDNTVLDRLKVGGKYRSSSGGVVDLDFFGKTSKNIGRVLADETQIPFIHTRPTKLLGPDSSTDMIRFSTGGDEFLKGADQGAQGYLWFRGTGRGQNSKGRVAKLGFGADGRATSEFLEGTYHSLSTNVDTFWGQGIRNAHGDSGRYANRNSRVRNRLHVAPEQPNSVGGLLRRFRDRKNDIRRPSVLVDRAASGTLARDLDTANAATSAFDHLRRFSFGGNLLREVRSAGAARYPELTAAFKYGDDFIPDIGPEKALRIAKEKLKNIDADDLDPAVARKVRKARNNILGKYADIEDANELMQPLSQTRRAGGLQRRIDELRLDLIRSGAVERGFRGDGSKFTAASNNMLKEIDEAYQAGMIGARERAESQAVITSFKEAFYSVSKHDASMPGLHTPLKVLDELVSSRPGVGLADDVNRVTRESAELSVHGRLATRIKRRFGVSDYEFDGTAYNPFSDKNVFVPSLPTAVKNNGIRGALGGVGIGSWNRQGVSKAGLFTGHLASRVNKAFSMFGARVDESHYGGPIDLIARGLIGKRMFPLFAGGTALMALDRTAGGYIHNDKDADGDRIYRPLVTGALGEVAMRAQVGLAGLTPGGMTAEEKRKELVEGDVAVRRGRWWPTSNTPWEGGKVEYYRPSWYRRMKSGYQYTDQLHGTPMEKLMFGHDFSPLRPFDPYRFERKHKEDRPYPVTGEYFTGPWGPITPMLNLTLGKVLKPSIRMHKEELQAELARFQPVGQAGMAPPMTDSPVMGEPVALGRSVGGFSQDVSRYQQAALGGPRFETGTTLARTNLLSTNDHLLNAARTANPVMLDNSYPFIPRTGDSLTSPRTPNDVVRMQTPGSPNALGYQAGELAYRAQEFAGIYGFGFGAARERLGLGSMEYESLRPKLASSSQAYGVGRQFWDLNLGGMGDVPSPFQGEYGNLELSEIVRRFIPKERAVNSINPLKNRLGREQPWLPGADYYLNLKRGDPYVAISDGEMRLPGKGYERFNNVTRGFDGQYSDIDKFKVLGDVAPYSSEFSLLKSQLKNKLGTYDRSVFDEVVSRADTVTRKHDFTPYEYKYRSAEERMLNPFGSALGSLKETFQHGDTFLHTKFMHNRTAVEDWERDYVYGASFPQWTNPYRDFIKPMAYKAADNNNPLMAGAGLALFGHLVGVSKEAKSIGRLLGGVTGFGISTYQNAKELATGDRFIPKERRREMAVEENIDILSYVKARRGFEIARSAGNGGLQQSYRQEMGRTMYGALEQAGTLPPEQALQTIINAVPKRKREHFESMLFAPEQERKRILSTAPRLERRLFQAAWGMEVEDKPELEEYFGDHELPGNQWEGWDPRVSMEHVKIKMLQREGLNLSQMGYYPQQIAEANLINPAYPSFDQGMRDPHSSIMDLMFNSGLEGSVRMIPTAFGRRDVDMSLGY